MTCWSVRGRRRVTMRSVQEFSLSIDKTYSCGSGAPGASVRTSRFEQFRALSGRRSPDKILAYQWAGAPYGTRTVALIE